MKKICLATLCCIFLLVFFVASISGAADAKTYKLRIQSVYPEVSHGPQMLKKFAERAEKYTNGRVKIEIFWPNQLVSLNEAYDAVSKGMVEGTYSCLIYYGGIVPEGKTEWLPFNWRTPEEAADLYLHRGYLDIMRKANAEHNIYYLFPMMSATMGCMTKFPVHTLADFQGKKMRASGLDGPIIKTIGVAPVALPASDQYVALQRGTVEGIIYPFYTIGVYKFYEVLKYIVLPGFHTPSISGVYLNLDFWKSLPPDLQFALDRAGQETMLLSAIASERWDKEAIVDAAKHGVKVVELPEADVKKLRTNCMPLWDKVGESTPACKEIVELFRNYLKEKGAL